MNDEFSLKIRVLAVLLMAGVFVSLDWVAGYLTYHLGDYRTYEQAYRIGADASSPRRPDPRYHHGLKAGFVGTDSWGPNRYLLVTNSLGFKDEVPRAVALHPAGHRLVFIGDSFTEGVGIPYPQTWVGRVAKVLAKQGVEVLDAGVVSYCAKTVYYKTKALLQDGLRFDHLIYFIDVSDVPDELFFNDFIPANEDPDDQWSGRYVTTPHLPAFYQYSLVLRTIRRLQHRDPWKQSNLTDRRTGDTIVFGNEREAWTRGPAFDWLGAAEASSTYYVTKLAALCKAHGIRFEVAIYPWPQEIRADDAHSRYRELWLRYATRHQLTCYDLHDVFFPAGAAARQEILAQDFIPGDIHWSVAGHRLVAQEWLRQYRRLHPLGEDAGGGARRNTPRR